MPKKEKILKFNDSVKTSEILKIHKYLQSIHKFKQELIHK